VKERAAADRESKAAFLEEIRKPLRTPPRQGRRSLLAHSQGLLCQCNSMARPTAPAQPGRMPPFQHGSPIDGFLSNTNTARSISMHTPSYGQGLARVPSDPLPHTRVAKLGLLVRLMRQQKTPPRRASDLALLVPIS
jgi:hypothetical protein